ncbi:MAG: hypothetical protein P4L50_06030, partial [Anaerolineaceae bacterium]|nr:hypothetical protein [Anaerolineaceae bacterium]
MAVPIVQIVLHRMGDRVDSCANPLPGGLKERGLEPLPCRLLGLLSVENHLPVCIGDIVRGAEGLLGPDRVGDRVVVAGDPGASVGALGVAEGPALLQHQPVGLLPNLELGPIRPRPQVSTALGPRHAHPRTSSGKFRANAWIKTMDQGGQGCCQKS